MERPEFIHQFDVGDLWTDEEIWNYAKEKNLTIVTKDADFSNRIITATPPPKVVHLKIGNTKIKELYIFLSKNWDEIVEISSTNKLISVYESKIGGIEIE